MSAEYMSKKLALLERIANAQDAQTLAMKNLVTLALFLVDGDRLNAIKGLARDIQDALAPGAPPSIEKAVDAAGQIMDMIED